MTRSTLVTANRNEVSKNTVRSVVFFEFVFPSATLRYCTADRDITWGGNTYTHTPILGSVEGVAEHSDLKARRVSFDLSGLDETILGKILQDAFHYSTVKLYWGFCNEAWRLVADPYQLSDELIMSDAPISIDESSGKVELSAETWDIFGERDSAVLATPETQRLRYAGDTGMDKVAALMTQQVEWGGRNTHISELGTSIQPNRKQFDVEP